MTKPVTIDGYSDQYTVDCERVLVTLLRGLGPWKDSVYLVGGLTPRYLVPSRPPVVPAHAGTLDVDIVIDLQILADTEAYHTLEHNLKRMGFERAENEAGKKLSWRWQTRTEHGALMVLELLADAPDIAGGKVQPLPTEGTISALNRCWSCDHTYARPSDSERWTDHRVALSYKKARPSRSVQDLRSDEVVCHRKPTERNGCSSHFRVCEHPESG